MTDLGFARVDGKKLKRGYTTGACAAGAAKAAVLLFVERVLPKEVEITLPGNSKLNLIVKDGEPVSGGARACIVKDGGDDPDVTHGLEIWAEVIPNASSGNITFHAGSGVGTVTKPGLQITVGEPAINPVPRKMITQAVWEALPPGWGAKVTISVPGGETVAKRTLNPKLGVVGGISILGTSGIVEPMSEEAFKTSLVPQLLQAKNLGHTAVVLVPGRIGATRASGIYGVPPEAIAEMSNFVGFMLMECVAQGFKEVILMGHISKLIKVAAGVFHTHNRVADARFETLITHCALLGMGRDDLKTLMENITIEGALAFVEQNGLEGVYPILAAEASKRAAEHTFGDLKVGTVLLNMAGDLLGLDQAAKEIAAQRGWKFPQ